MSSTSIAIITGGAGDIGRAIARHLAPTHSHILLLDIDRSKLEEARDKLPTEIRDKILVRVCDVTDSSSLSQVARETFESSGPRATLKTLVNNAGGTKAGSLHEMTPSAWKQEIALNLDAAYFCFHAFSPLLLKNNADAGSTSSVINISSANGVLSTFGNPAYSAAKAGLIHFTRSITVEYAKFGVRANVVAPGTVMTDAWRGKVENNPDVFDEVTKWCPSGRLVEVDEVASAVAFLASDQAKGINGVCLPVDGGLTAGMPPIARSFGVSQYY